MAHIIFERSEKTRKEEDGGSFSSWSSYESESEQDVDVGAAQQQHQQQQGTGAQPRRGSVVSVAAAGPALRMDAALSDAAKVARKRQKERTEQLIKARQAAGSRTMGERM